MLSRDQVRGKRRIQGSVPMLVPGVSLILWTLLVTLSSQLYSFSLTSTLGKCV